jgi:hypothetical protein
MNGSTVVALTSKSPQYNKNAKDTNDIYIRSTPEDTDNNLQMIMQMEKNGDRKVAFTLL